MPERREDVIPFCTDTVTHYHYAGRDTWTRNVLRGVHWRYGTTNSAAQSSDGRIERVPQTRIIIPHSLLQDIEIDTGGRDYFVLGDGPDITANYTPADLKRDHPELGTAKTVEDHTRAPHLKHWKVILG